MLHPSEIAKLVHVYLKDEGYSKSCDIFERECQLLNNGFDLSFSKLGKAGANLSSILNDSLLLKETDIDIEKKEALSVLQALWKQLDTLIAQLKYASLKASSPSNQKKPKSQFSQSVRSKLAGQSRRPSIYRKRSTDLKENSLAIPLAKVPVPKRISSEDQHNHDSNITKKPSTSTYQPSNNDSSQLFPFNVSNLGQAHNNVAVVTRECGSVLSGMPSKNVSVISPEILNLSYTAITPPRAPAATSSQQVLPFIPHTPGAFLVQPTSQQFICSPGRSTCIEMGSTTSLQSSTNQQHSLVHSAPICTNQQSSSVSSGSLTPLKTHQPLGSTPTTPFNTTQHLASASGFPPTPGAFLLSQNSVGAAVRNNLTNTDSNGIQLSEPNSFSNGSPITVTSRSDLFNSDTAPVTMATTVGEQAQGSPGTPGQLNVSSSVDGRDQNNMPIQKGFIQDTGMDCTCEVIEEGLSGDAVPVSQDEEQNSLLNSEALNKNSVITSTADTRSTVADLPGLASPMKGELSLGDLSLRELQLRSPRRKCPQPKKRAVTAESPMKSMDGEQKSTKEDFIPPGTCESGNIAMPYFLETLLGTPSLQEKLAENINKIVSRQEGPDVTNKSKQVSAGEAEQVDCTQPSLAVPVDDILELTQSDPAFEALFTLFGSDALEEKEDCSAATETSLPQTSPHVQSTISDSATLVTDALLLLSSSPQKKGFQVRSENPSVKEQTVTSPLLDSTLVTTNETTTVGHEPSTTISVSSAEATPTSSTVSDSMNLRDTHTCSAGLILPSTTSVCETSTVSTVGKQSTSQVVKEAIRTKHKRRQRKIHQPPPIESHVRSLNFGEVVSRNSSQENNPYHRSQGSSSAARNTNSSAAVQSDTCLASHHSNIGGSSNQDRGHLRTMLSMHPGTVSSFLPAATGFSGGLSVPTSFNSTSLIQPINVETLQIQDDSKSAMCANPLQIARGTSSAASVQMATGGTPNTASLQITPQGNPGIAPVQSRAQFSPNFAPMQATLQGTPNIASTQTAHSKYPIMAPIPSRTQGTPSGVLMYPKSQDTPSATAVQSNLSNSQHVKCAPEVISQTLLPSVQGTCVPSTANISSVNELAVHQDSGTVGCTAVNCTEKTRNLIGPSASSQVTGCMSECSNKSGAKLRALQLTAEQDAKSLFGCNTNWYPGTLSATRHIIRLSRQYAAKEGLAVDTGRRSPAVLGYQAHDYGSISNFSPIPRPSSAPTVGVTLSASAQCSNPEAASLQATERGHSQRGIHKSSPITNTTLPPSPVTIGESAATQLTGNASTAITWTKQKSPDVPGKHSASSFVEHREKFMFCPIQNTAGAAGTQTVTGATRSLLTVSTGATSTSTVPAAKSSTVTISSTLHQKGEQFQSYSTSPVSTCSVAVVTSHSNSSSSNVLSSVREQIGEFRSSDVAKPPVVVANSERAAGKLDEIQGGLRDLHSPVDIATDSPASSYCSEISSPNNEVNTDKGSRKRGRSTTPEPKKKRSKHSRTSKKMKKKLATVIPTSLENLDVDKFLSKLHYDEK